MRGQHALVCASTRYLRLEVKPSSIWRSELWGGMDKVYCIIAARNESRFLPGFLSHVGPFVDGIVGLDDGSTDETRAIMEGHPNVVSVLSSPPPSFAHEHETENRHRLLTEAQRLGAGWILCGDADERFEQRFLDNIRKEMFWGNLLGRVIRTFQLVNLWNSEDHYRIDGRCGPRPSPRMFRLPKTFSRRPENQMHRPWYPPELDRRRRANMNYFLYHLRMIDRADREARWQKFTTIDPANTHQKIGYGHLIDEEGLTLKKIPPGRGYRLS